MSSASVCVGNKSSETVLSLDFLFSYRTLNFMDVLGEQKEYKTLKKSFVT